MRKQTYWIKDGAAKTYKCRVELGAMGCFYDPDKNMWKLMNSLKDSDKYKEIERMGLRLIPVELSPECQKIQDILSNK